MPITQVGESPTYLTFVIEGRARVEKEGNSFEIGPRVFVGELAFAYGEYGRRRPRLLLAASVARGTLHSLAGKGPSARRHPQIQDDH